MTVDRDRGEQSGDPGVARVEALLRAAASDAAWPVTPELRGPVLRAISARRGAPSAPARGGSRMRLVRALGGAVLGLLVLAGVAAALGYRLPGLDILFTDRRPPPGAGLDLGVPIPLDEARRLGRPVLLLPGELAEPEAAFVLGTGGRRILTVAWRAPAGTPSLPGTDLALTLMAVPGDTDEALLSKILGPGTTIELVDVAGSRGWWIAGAPHEILLRRPDGTVGALPPALAGDTLVFARNGTVYRLESALGRDRTLAIAGSLR